MLVLGLLLVSLGLILLGAGFFTNAIEWLGRLMKLSEGAVGSILAAVGTALPETMIPVIAIFSGKEGGEEIGIGAILGAPFMLATLALGITGMAVVVFQSRRKFYPELNVDPEVISRDLHFFLVVYAVAILAAFIPHYAGKLLVAGLLVVVYLVYLLLTWQGKPMTERSLEIKPLYFAGQDPNPDLKIVLLQVALALGIIIFGAHIFVDSVKIIAQLLDLPTIILALIIAPVATELPEKLNSIIWIRAEKDTLAIGNITGAMVFQSSLIPALGITMTSWALTPVALTSAILTLISAGLVAWQIRRKKSLTLGILSSGVLFYLIFVLLVAKRMI